jgi:hypothetical protein
MSSRGFTPPDDETHDTPGEVLEGEPDTKDDEFAKDDAPEQEFDDEREFEEA